MTELYNSAGKIMDSKERNEFYVRISELFQTYSKKCFEKHQNFNAVAGVYESLLIGMMMGNNNEYVISRIEQLIAQIDE